MVEFKEFRVGDIFDTVSIPQIPRGFQVEYKEYGIPYVTQKNVNNGMNGYIEETDELTLIDEPLIILGVDNIANGVCYWWDKPFYGNKLLALKSANLNSRSAKYVITSLLAQYRAYDYNNKISKRIVEDTEIELPVTTEGKVDYEYMENYIKEMEQKYVNKLKETLELKIKTTLEVIGREDLTVGFTEQNRGDAEYSPLTLLSKLKEELGFETKEFGEFNLGEMFNIGRGNVKNQKDVKLDEGGGVKVALVVQNNTDNGYVKDVYTSNYKVFPKNTIAIGRQTGVVYLQKEEFITTDGVIVLEPKEGYFGKSYTDTIGMYLTSVLSKQMVTFGYTNTVSAAKLNELSIKLPITEEGAPDYKYMEQYISYIELAHTHTSYATETERIKLIEDLVK